MIRFDQIGYLPALNAGAETPRAQADSAAFSALFAQTRSEVHRYIEEGQTQAMPLSPEGFALRNASVQPAALDADKQAFIMEMLPYAREASAKLGVASDILLAHAALESGWGKAVINQANGQSAFNLFGIKAAGAWRGLRADVLTTEFENGAALKKIDQFRAYPDYRSAFQDYTSFFSESKRFRPAMGSGNSAEAFTSALVKGGYATDPAYAEKLLKVVATVRALKP
ncbi:glucosaminidase domain-containing protein [Iodobacter sp. CM08]|uniref:glucosaminidase domain-containing protein n=1 Tax=Iodobacter sp. CM08 TaxID=3085902 RepID=UPI002980AB08|nr:glucosaminidase domain-containing protein [Iodobacter sp. CM08]MDW5417379.1 glucosaminidase domain-containing protein [Iodobacter sp. CM08]